MFSGERWACKWNCDNDCDENTHDPCITFLMQFFGFCFTGAYYYYMPCMEARLVSLRRASDVRQESADRDKSILGVLHRNADGVPCATAAASATCSLGPSSTQSRAAW